MQHTRSYRTALYASGGVEFASKSTRALARISGWINWRAIMKLLAAKCQGRDASGCISAYSLIINDSIDNSAITS